MGLSNSLDILVLADWLGFYSLVHDLADNWNFLSLLHYLGTQK